MACPRVKIEIEDGIEGYKLIALDALRGMQFAKFPNNYKNVSGGNDGQFFEDEFAERCSTLAFREVLSKGLDASPQ